MKTENKIMYRTTFTISLTMVIMSLMIIPMLSRESGEFVITILSLIINLFVISFIFIKQYFMYKKIR